MTLPVIFLVIGFLAGILSGLFGIGGGLVIVPALIWIARMQPIQATGTSLGALLLPVGLLGAYEYHRKGNIDVMASLLIAAGLLVGAWIGARWAHMLPPLYLKRGFALLLAVAAVRMWFSGK